MRLKLEEKCYKSIFRIKPQISLILYNFQVLKTIENTKPYKVCESQETKPRNFA